MERYAVACLGGACLASSCSGVHGGWHLIGALICGVFCAGLVWSLDTREKMHPRRRKGRAMQVPLRDLMPHWLVDGARAGMGVRFQCPCQHQEHEISAWFEEPLDGQLPVTLSETRRQLYQHEGTNFDSLSLYPPITCGDCLIVVYEGKVNIIYLD